MKRDFPVGWGHEEHVDTKVLKSQRADILGQKIVTSLT